MRIGLSWATAFAFAAAIAGCGGKVVVDMGNPIGSGGAGGSGVTTGTVVTTGTGGDCGGLCSATQPDGSCECTGVCNEQKLDVQCQPTQGGGSCTCIENGIKIGVCVQAGSFDCTFNECCAQYFFGQAGGG